MEKTDLRKELKHLYHPSAKVIAEVQVPLFKYLMVDGKGDPNSSATYAAAVEALFSVSYTAKFMLRKEPEKQDYAVMPLEGLWWADDMAAFHTGDRANWQWTMMIMQPAFVPDATLHRAMAEVAVKKRLPAIAQLRIESLEEGHCAQILHIGPFSAEGPTIKRLHVHIEARSGLRGKHHEIYLTDIRRAAPSRWKTVIRQPMR
jgi:hypothetical protein